MKTPVFYFAGQTDAMAYVRDILSSQGFTLCTQPDNSVTHLVLPVPSFEVDGSIKGGGQLKDILTKLSRDITVIGGNLTCSQLANFHCIDLLQDPFYLAENAQITAHCAIKVACNHLPVTLQNCPVLVIGGGRIGKCLAQLLKNLGAQVTVAVRKTADRAIFEVLGYETLDSTTLEYSLARFRVIFNTVPSEVISQNTLAYCNKDCLKVELASKKGIDAEDVIWARGLPNREAPESSGKLIAKTLLRRYQEGV